ncbi:TerB family tellurite resistance protein [Idiomarina xiamenensis]|uniref:Co-chaperone DjlA N-terminal domain-containing protein n=1 Tax=Idiomarina xiamenensis 10-D-4 TaxID=740709 RepID=K2KIH6_9GAMM|nr:TerB family tellurite resistance protein [Idiomarina xiamenensis]EKE87668.1 hypothetical protein A10D4_01200 [Idiomarina xiamenensis 10-D-4]
MNSPAVAGLNQQQLLALVLMIEISRADFDEDEHEQRQALQYLQDEYRLSSEQADEAYRVASSIADNAASLHDYTHQLKQLEYGERVNLLKSLWQTAYADNVLDPYEEAMLRKIADLLYISHPDYIRTKLAVMS